MSCNELERLLRSDAAEALFATHRASCRDCETLGRELDHVVETIGAIRPPAWSAALRESLYSVPSRTVPCETADELLAAKMEGEIYSADAARLDGHLSRCDACAEAAATLLSARELTSPSPVPWLTTRLAATTAQRPRRQAKRRRWFLSPRTPIYFAYAAAVVVMLAGWNPADIARAGAQTVEAPARAAVAEARRAFVDRFGVLQEKAIRTFQVIKGHAGGYGRAVLSAAVGLVMKPENPPSRPKNGQSGDAPKGNEISVLTYRA